MKKSLILFAAAALTLASCGGNAESKDTPADSTAQTEEVAAEETKAAPEEKKEELEAGPVTLDFKNLNHEQTRWRL